MSTFPKLIRGSKLVKICTGDNLDSSVLNNLGGNKKGLGYTAKSFLAVVSTLVAFGGCTYKEASPFLDLLPSALEPAGHKRYEQEEARKDREDKIYGRKCFYFTESRTALKAKEENGKFYYFQNSEWHPVENMDRLVFER